MRTRIIAAATMAFALAACATPPKDFYADPTKPKDTALCRAHLESTDPQFKYDTGLELAGRGLTLEECQNRVTMETVAIVGIAAVATGVAVAAACQNGCAGGNFGSASYADYDCYGGKGDGPHYVHGPVAITGYDQYGLDADKDGIGCEASDLTLGA